MGASLWGGRCFPDGCGASARDRSLNPRPLGVCRASKGNTPEGLEDSHPVAFKSLQLHSRAIWRDAGARIKERPSRMRIRVLLWVEPGETP